MRARIVIRAATSATTAVVLLALGACGGVRSPAKVASHPGANLLLITLDTTRADHLGCYGYEAAETPVLDTLADEGILFETCITPTAFTLPSHSSIMTGVYPPFHGVRLNGGAALADTHVTLAERLSAAGYRTGAFIGAFVLDSRWGLDQGFGRYDDHFELGADQRLDLSRVQRPANQVVDAAIEWLDQGGPQSFFAWVHLYDPHTPYEPPEPFRSRFEGRGPHALYDAEIAFTDSQVGRLLQWLDEHDLGRRTLVVIVADHGEGLGSHGEDEHGYFIYDYAVHVPLLMRMPDRGLAGTRVSAQVRTIDLVPTLSEILGLGPPETTQGESLMPLIGDPELPGPEYAYSESMATRLQYGWAALYSLRTGRFKLIEAPRSELYDLDRDGGETTNLLHDQPQVAATLERALAALRDRIEEGAPATEEADIDEKTLSMLASLGYVGGGGSVVEDDTERADPKDTIHLYDSLGYVAHLMGEEDYEEAVEVLKIVLEADPAIPQAQLLLASAYQKTGRRSEAKTILEGYLGKDPNSVRALIAMAEILSEEGRTDEVLAMCRRTLAVDDRNTQAYELMAGVSMAADDHAGALPLLEKVVAIQPKLTRNRNNLAASLIGLGRLDEAEGLLTEILAEHPKFPMANFHMGLLREQQGRLDEARHAYEVEVSNYPDAIAPRFNLGNLLLAAGEPDAAATHLRHLIEVSPGSARSYLLLARALLKDAGSNLSEVESMARSGLERAESADLKALGYFLLADVYSRQGRSRELEEAVRKGRYFQGQIDG
jgi:choline-sulfatase